MASSSRTSERKALDLSHHLSELAKRRQVSPLKGIFKYAFKPGIIMLAGGLPAPDYFPFHSISADVLVKDSFALDAVFEESSTSWFWKLFGASGKKEEKTTTMTIPKFPTAMGQVNLATSLQYGAATGIVQLQAIFKEFSTKVYQPAYDDFATLIHTGNTDAWTRCVLTLMNSGEGFLTEEWTYPSALASAQPYGIHAVSVPIDSNGMRPEDLRKILAEWDESARGMKRPRVMYTVPVGQNPSGVNVPARRKKEIYDICVEYDIILVEDDPYYFQQFDLYDSKRQASSSSTYDVQRYLSTLVPSYLKFDYQGRVIRLDTFSKTIAPGSRLGWFTCSPLFAERLERQGETTTQAPCGFGQSLVTQLLLTWKYDGYVRWLHGINQQYQARRDYFMHALADAFALHEASTPASRAWRGCRVLTAHEKIEKETRNEKRVFGRKRFFSFVPPAAGMFIWMKLHFEGHPACLRGEEDEKSLEMKLWVKLAEAGVLFSPGWFFSADEDHDEEQGQGHFRISFSSATPDQMKKASKIFADVLDEFWA